MKLGIVLLLLGLVLAGAGLAGWVFAETGVSYHNEHSQPSAFLPSQAVDAICTFCLVSGCGLVTGGIVRMILKRGG